MSVPAIHIFTEVLYTTAPNHALHQDVGCLNRAFRMEFSECLRSGCLKCCRLCGACAKGGVRAELQREFEE